MRGNDPWWILRFVVAVTVAAAPGVASAPALAQPQEEAMTVGREIDGSEVRARVEAYRSAWNAHDASGLAAFFTEAADLVMGNLPAARGRQQIRTWWQNYFARQEPERRLSLDVGPVGSIAADVSVINVTTTTGGYDRDGRELSPRRFRGAWLWRRQGGDWLISAMRGLPDEEDHVVLNASLEAAEALRPDIRAFVAAYEDAWNSQDPFAVGALFGDDAQIVIRNLPVIRGREAILAWWDTYFSEPRPYRALFIVDAVRKVASDVALINVIATGSANGRSAGQPLPVRYARGTWVVVRRGGEWLISAMWVLPSEDDEIVRRGSPLRPVQEAR